VSVNPDKVVVAMSGGVDSSVAACLLQEHGYEVVGAFMRTGAARPADRGSPPIEDGLADVDRPENGLARDAHCRGSYNSPDAADAGAVARKLGIPFFILNLWPQFDRIIDYFADEYLRGRTPNPCVMCNKQLKFARLMECARKVGAGFIATGHHARIDRRDGLCRLRRGVDERKDQSYVLFRLDLAVLSKTLLPIGERAKDEIRRDAQRFGLSVWDKPDSQDICFVPNHDYAGVVRQRRPEAFVQGPIVDADGNEVGRHEGIANFTIGQRRGLGVAMGEPIYVTRLDVERNTVVIGTRQDLASDRLYASRVHWLMDPPTRPFRADVQIRYAHRGAPARVDPVGPDCFEVSFDEPQFAVTPGQAAVFYTGDVVLGGGWID